MFAFDISCFSTLDILVVKAPPILPRIQPIGVCALCPVEGDVTQVPGPTFWYRAHASRASASSSLPVANGDVHFRFPSARIQLGLDVPYR